MFLAWVGSSRTRRPREPMCAAFRGGYWRRRRCSWAFHALRCSGRTQGSRGRTRSRQRMRFATLASVGSRRRSLTFLEIIWRAECPREEQVDSCQRGADRLKDGKKEFDHASDCCVVPYFVPPALAPSGWTSSSRRRLWYMKDPCDD